MKPFRQAPFSPLPARLLLFGLLLYIGLELTASFCLQYIPALQGEEQLVLVTARLLELLGFILCLKQFSALETMGLSKPNSEDLKIFLLISTISVLSVVLLYLLQPSWFAYVGLPPWLQGMTGLLLMVLLAPVVEEFVFRGLFYRILREQWGVAPSVTVSAVFFSLIHHGMIISPQLAGGIIFALAYEWSRSLWVAILLHMGANAAVYGLAMFL